MEVKNENWVDIIIRLKEEKAPPLSQKITNEEANIA